MEKNYYVIKNTGLKVQETFTIRLHITKALVQEHLSTRDWPNLISSFSFNRGLLYGVPNSFELKVLPELAGIEVYYPREMRPLSSNQLNKVRISGMKLSLLTDDDVGQFSKEMLSSSTSPQAQNSDTDFQQSFKVTLSSANWPNSMNELKIDIIGSMVKKAEYHVTESQLPVSAQASLQVTNALDTTKYFVLTPDPDVVIHCYSESFPVHIDVLKRSSPVFDKMFEHDMMESKEKLVKISDAESMVVREMLRYFYTKDVQNMETVVTDLFQLADKYFVQDLKDYCKQFLLESVTKDNALDIYNFARLQDIPGLAKAAKDALIIHKNELVKCYKDLQNFLGTVSEPVATELFQEIWNTN